MVVVIMKESNDFTEGCVEVTKEKNDFKEVLQSAIYIADVMESSFHNNSESFRTELGRG